MDHFSSWLQRSLALCTTMVSSPANPNIPFSLTIFSSVAKVKTSWTIIKLHWVDIRAGLRPNIEGYAQTRICLPITVIFDLWRNYLGSGRPSSIRSFVQVSPWNVALCWHGLSYYLKYFGNWLTWDRTPTHIIGCGEVRRTPFLLWGINWFPISLSQPMALYPL